MTNLKVSAAIVTYNRLTLLKESMTAVLNQDTPALQHLIVINNNSTDGTAEFLQTPDDSRIIAINLTENGGGAGGFNQAVKTFMSQTDDDLVWLMDDDTIPTPAALSHLLAFYEAHPESGFVNSNVRWQTTDGKPSWMNVVNPETLKWPTFLLPGELQGIQISNSTFVSVMIPREQVLAVGLPQKEYFIWGDDIEYTNRIADRAPGYMAVDSIAVHKSANNDKPGDIVNERDDKRMWRYRYEFRNRVLTGKRRGGKKTIRAILHSVLDFFKVLFKPNVAFRFKKLGLIFVGTIKGIFFSPMIEYPAGHTASVAKEDTIKHD